MLALLAFQARLGAGGMTRTERTEQSPLCHAVPKALKRLLSSEVLLKLASRQRFFCVPSKTALCCRVPGTFGWDSASANQDVVLFP